MNKKILVQAISLLTLSTAMVAPAMAESSNYYFRYPVNASANGVDSGGTLPDNSNNPSTPGEDVESPFPDDKDYCETLSPTLVNKWKNTSVDSYYLDDYNFENSLSMDFDLINEKASDLPKFPKKCHNSMLTINKGNSIQFLEHLEKAGWLSITDTKASDLSYLNNIKSVKSIDIYQYTGLDRSDISRTISKSSWLCQKEQYDLFRGSDIVGSKLMQEEACGYDVNIEGLDGVKLNIENVSSEKYHKDDDLKVWFDVLVDPSSVTDKWLFAREYYNSMSIHKIYVKITETSTGRVLDRTNYKLNMSVANGGVDDGRYSGNATAENVNDKGSFLVKRYENTPFGRFNLGKNASLGNITIEARIEVEYPYSATEKEFNIEGSWSL